MAFELPLLSYEYTALEPHIDAKTMEIHHSKHHAAYVNSLNNALVDYPDLQSQSIDKLLSDLNAIPEAVRTAVRNFGGGHFNHTFFWKGMGPNAGGEPSGALASAIKNAFGNFVSFKELFSKKAATHFGSGWAWLIKKSDQSLEVISTANQDSPISTGLIPILVIDVWEHAYYLKFQNRRPDYITTWWNVVNWAVAEKIYEEK